MIAVELRRIKAGQYFTIKELSEPKSNQVWVRQHYDRSSKTYSACSFDDINRERFFKPNRIVYIDFYF